MIIDIHGHYTTAPKALEAWRKRQVAAIDNAAAMPKPSELRIGDDELRESIETNQLRLMRERGIDLTVFSPRASFITGMFDPLLPEGEPGQHGTTDWVFVRLRYADACFDHAATHAHPCACASNVAASTANTSLMACAAIGSSADRRRR